MVHQVKDVTDFDSQLESAGDKLVIVDFFATWCGPCRFIAPKLEEMSQQDEYKNVVFLKVDVDDNDDISKRYEVSCMPTFIYIKNKQKVDELSGANEDKLKELLNKHK